MASKAERTMEIQSRHGENFEAFGEVDPRTPHTIRRKGEQQIIGVAVDICISKSGLLCYYDLERGHMLKGKLLRWNRDGGFSWKYVHAGGYTEVLTFMPLTMEDFDTHLRQLCTAVLSAALHDLDDVCVWYRRRAGLV